MNRKLINGLLLLSVTAGGVGMFTSCKDNESVSQTENNKTLSKLFDLLDSKIKNGETNLEVVRKKLNSLMDANLLTMENQEYLYDLIQNNKNYAEALKVYVDDMVVSLITNVEIQEVYNPAYGSINLPIGIQSSLLCNYYYQGNQEIEFPVANTSYVYGEKEAIAALDKSGLTIPNEKFGTEVEESVNLGTIYVTINPSNVPSEVIDGLKISLEKSNGVEVFGELKAVKENDHVINMGLSRAGNGFYAINVTATGDKIQEINIKLDEALKKAAREFVNSPSKSDLVTLADAIYKQFNDRIPLLALNFTSEVKTSFNYMSTPWNPTPGGLVLANVTNTDGKYSTTEGEGKNDPEGVKGEETETSSNPDANPILRSIYTRYAIAAVTYHPLSFSFDPSGYVPSHRLPQVGHIQEYVNKALDKVNLELNLGGLKAEDYNIDLSGVKFTVDPTTLTVDLAGLPVVDNNNNVIGKLGDDAKVVLGYNQEGEESLYFKPEALNELIDNIVKAVNGEGDDSFKGQIQAQVTSQLQNIISDINGQLESVNTQISDKIADIKNSINNQLNGRVGDGVNRLIDLYNKVAKKVNTLLDDPNAALQVYAAYKDGNGSLHHFSTVKNDPSVFTPGTGDAIEMFLTNYNAEILTPAYKKYVAVVADLTDGSDVKAINDAEYLNKILDGRQQQTYIPVKDMKAGHTYQVVYAALDYRGNVSARSFYVRLAK